MERRSTRNKKGSSPIKRARASLDFGSVENTPPRKRPCISLSDTDSDSSKQPSPDVSGSPHLEEEENPIAIKSFYGKREKRNFPHSPKRRKAVDQLLHKLTGEANSSGEEVLQSPSAKVNRVKPVSDGKKETTRKAFRQRKVSNNSENQQKTQSPLLSPPPKNHVTAFHTPVSKSHDHTPVSKSQEPVATPTNQSTSGKKFFKHKSPGTQYSERVILRKGFNLSFTTRRSIGSSEKKGKSKKSTKKTQKNGAKVNKEPKPKKAKGGGSDKVLEGQKDSVDDFDSAIGSANSAEMSPSANTAASPRPNHVCGTPIKSLVKGTESMDSPSKNLRSRTQSSHVLSEDMKSYTGSDDLFSSQPDCEAPPSDITSGRDTPNSDLTIEISSENPTSSHGSGTITPASLSPGKKYFPIFTSQGTPKQQSQLKAIKGVVRNSPRSSPRLKFIENKSDQMTLDAGQKKYGATQCDVCGMVYTQADPADETTHSVFHHNLLNALKFPGWKKERVVQEFPEDGSRALMILDDDPKYAVRKVEEINKLMGVELGFPEPDLAFRPGYKAFILISDDKRVMGCCVAEPVTEGYRVIPDSQPSQEPGHRPWCCKSEPEPASVGISRIWVNKQDRRKGVATKLLDCVRKWFQYGTFIHRSRVAFSDPTPDGKAFAAHYTRTSSFLVYKYG